MTNPWKLYTLRPGEWNYNVDVNPVYTDAIDKGYEIYFDWDARTELVKQVWDPALADVRRIQLPVPVIWIFWQPWLKCYSGETKGGYMCTHYGERWAWIDQDMREEMTGKR